MGHTVILRFPWYIELIVTYVIYESFILYLVFLNEKYVACCRHHLLLHLSTSSSVTQFHYADRWVTWDSHCMTLFCKLFKRFDHTESECTQQANGRVKAVGSVSVGIIPDDVDTDESIIQTTEHYFSITFRRRLRGQAVARWTTDHYHPCSNPGVGISEGRFIFHFVSLPLEVTRPI
jgi:hypothetical protein